MMKLLKKILLLSLVLFVFGVLEVSAAPSPTNVTLSNPSSWEVSFTPVDGVKEYQILILKNGQLIDYTTHYISLSDSYKNRVTVMTRCLNEIFTEGEYVAIVRNTADDFANGVSPVYKYTYPSSKLAKPSNPTYRPSTATFSWGSVSGANRYRIELGVSFAGRDEITLFYEDVETNGTSFSFTEDIDFYNTYEKFVQEEFDYFAEYEDSISESDIIRTFRIISLPSNDKTARYACTDWYTFSGSYFCGSFENESVGELGFAEFDPWDPGTLLFTRATGVTDYRVRLYKNGKLFKKKDVILDYYGMQNATQNVDEGKLWLLSGGSGSYHFTVHKIINGKEVGEPAISNTYVYTPKTTVNKPTNLNVNASGQLSFTGVGADGYGLGLAVTYDGYQFYNIHYIPAIGTRTSFNLAYAEYREYFIAFIEQKYRENPTRYPKNKAKLAAFVIADGDDLYDPETEGRFLNSAKSKYHYINNDALASVSGTVYVNNIPVANAEIYINGTYVDTTNIYGHYDFIYKKGTYTFTVKANGMSEIFTVTLGNDGVSMPDISLTQKSRSLEIHQNSVSRVSGIDATLFTTADDAYAATEGNIVTADVKIQEAEDTSAITSHLQQTYPSYTPVNTFDVNITKIRTGEENSETPMTETTNPLQITLDLSSMDVDPSALLVFREHNGSVDVLSADASQDEYFTIDGDTLTIHAKKFSTYALAEKKVIHSIEKTENGYDVTIALNDTVLADGQRATMAVALYDAKHVLTGVSSLLSVSNTFANTINVESGEATECQVFLWDNPNACTPLCAPFTQAITTTDEEDYE